MNIQSFDDILSLPIYGRRDNILASVDANQVTIITAETGAGKSTQVPQFLAEHGFTKVIVTQPRILAARNLSARVRQEYSWRLGKDCSDLVGYRTAHERDDGSDTVILYCTDGLQLVRELTGSGIAADRQILVLDEIHEWNENMEVLIAWAKKRCQEDSRFRVVLMSATIEADSLATYFGSAEPLSITGRSYDVEKRYGGDIINEILNQLSGQLSSQTSPNILVFLPGKAEIENVADAIAAKAASLQVPVIPLHSQLNPAQQQLAFSSYPQGKVILTTNVAQTSITIDDIDVVIDSGLERRAEVRNGVEGLFIAQISQADCLQRAGRAGRTKPGLYILAQYDSLPCLPLDNRPPYGVPEILRKHIDRLVLRLANIDIDIEELEFYHSPSHRTVRQAKRTLIDLGAMTNSGAVTPIGRKMERFPVESGYARMLVESENYPAVIRSKLAAIIAIQEVGGIVKGGPRWTGWRQYTHQTRSDLLAQYDVYLALPTIPEQLYDELGIIGKNITKAQEVNQRLDHDLGLDEASLTPVDNSEVDQLLQCIVASQLHQLWVVEPDGEARLLSDRASDRSSDRNAKNNRETREISSGTVVKHAGLVAGVAFDLQVPTPKGPKALDTLYLVNDVTAVDPAWLEALAPDLYQVKPGRIYYDSHYGALAAHTVLRYAGKSFETAGTPIMDHTSTNQQLFVTLYANWLHDQLEKTRKAIQIHNHRRIPIIPVRQIQSHVRHIAQGAVSLHEMSKKQRIELAKLSQLETYLDANFMARLNTVPERSQARSSHSGRHHLHRHQQSNTRKHKHNRWRES